MTSSAQPIGDGVPLLRQVAEAARSAKGWRAEGSGDESRWTVSTRGPLEMRYGGGRGAENSQIVCDGATRWSKTLHIGPPSFGTEEEMHAATAKECSPPALRWEDLLDSLLFAAFDGKDSALGCTLVRAEYAAESDLDTRNTPAYQLRPVTRELCV